jgi:BirA family transcriptional regulator, biotin operon repressor / biotin---[acetyl-CoA-carboxylase] ligase
MAEALERSGARLGIFGTRLLFFSEVGSTNDVAARLAGAGTPEGTVVVADTQSEGRGRRGRSWHSPPGAGVYLSAVLRPRSEAATRKGGQAAGAAALLTLMTGVAVAEGLRALTGLPIEIKWPNDLVVEGRKLCGILAEGSGTGEQFDYVVLGIGINVLAAAFPAELAAHVTSVESELGRRIDRGDVLVATLSSLAERYGDMRTGRSESVLEMWRRMSPSSVGTRVTWVSAGSSVEGTTDGIDERGALLIRVEDRLERVIAGEIVWPARR